MVRKCIIFAILLLCAMSGVAYASDEGYVQINNNRIVTNRGQRFQVVAQFGNRGQETIHIAWVECSVLTGAQAIGNIYSQFSNVYKAQEGDIKIAGGYYIDLPPGQNYNFSFDVRVDRNAPSESTAWCNLWGFDGTTWYWLDDAYVDVVIQ